MKIDWKKTGMHIAFIAAALILALLFSFKSPTFNLFAIKTLVFGVFIYLIMFCMYSLLNSLIIQKDRMKILFSLAALAAIIFFMIFTSFEIFGIGCESGKTLPHFRWNTIINSCEFSGYSKKCNVTDPWYYETGCRDLSNEKKYKFMNQTKYFDTWMNICSNYCYEGNRERFCKEEDGQLPCRYLISCNGLEC